MAVECFSEYICVCVAGAVCDEECNNFRQLLQSWSPTKPKAVIYFLVQKSSLKLLQKSLHSLDRLTECSCSRWNVHYKLSLLNQGQSWY